MLPYRDSWITKALLAVFFIVLVGYGYYEARGLLFGPSIDISAGRAMIVYQPYIELKGTASRISQLSMNGQQIPVTEDGSFDQPYVLSPGYNRIIFDAKDQYGKTAQRVIEVVYEASSTPTIAAPTAATTTGATSTAPTSLPASTSTVAH